MSDRQGELPKPDKPRMTQTGFLELASKDNVKGIEQIAQLRDFLKTGFLELSMESQTIDDPAERKSILEKFDQLRNIFTGPETLQKPRTDAQRQQLLNELRTQDENVKKQIQRILEFGVNAQLQESQAPERDPALLDNKILNVALRGDESMFEIIYGPDRLKAIKDIPNPERPLKGLLQMLKGRLEQ